MNSGDAVKIIIWYNNYLNAQRACQKFIQQLFITKWKQTMIINTPRLANVEIYSHMYIIIYVIYLFMTM